MQLLFSAKFHRACALLAVSAALFALSSRCFADPITLTSTAVSSIQLGPSADTLSLHAGSVSSSTSSGTIAFQTGDFLIGNSPIPDQIVPFSFDDTLTLDGITQILDIAAQVDVTTTADTLSIFAGPPVVFGNEIFTLQPFSTTGTAIGEDLAVDLQGSVGPTSPISPTPEPSSLTLLGTGAVVALLLAVMSRRSLVESIPDAPPTAPIFGSRTPSGTGTGAWVRRGAAFQPAAPGSGRASLRDSLAAASSEGRPVETLPTE